MGARTRAWIVVAALVFVIGIVPVVLDRDSFPVSTYPMFSTRRTTTESVDTAVLVRDGRTRRLSPRTIADTDEVILAAATVSNAIANGTTPTLCAEIAQRLRTDHGEVQVITERYDSVRWYEGDHTPLQRIVHASCPAKAAS